MVLVQVRSDPLVLLETWRDVAEAARQRWTLEGTKKLVLNIGEPTFDSEEAELHDLLSNVPQYVVAEIVATTIKVAAGQFHVRMPEAEALRRHPWVLAVQLDNRDLPAKLRAEVWVALTLIPDGRKSLIAFYRQDYQRAREGDYAQRHSKERLRLHVDEEVFDEAYERKWFDVLFKHEMAVIGALTIVDYPEMTGRALHEKIRRELKLLFEADHASKRQLVERKVRNHRLFSEIYHHGSSGDEPFTVEKWIEMQYSRILVPDGVEWIGHKVSDLGFGHRDLLPAARKLSWERRVLAKKRAAVHWLDQITSHITVYEWVAMQWMALPLKQRKEELKQIEDELKRKRLARRLAKAAERGYRKLDGAIRGHHREWTVHRPWLPVVDRLVNRDEEPSKLRGQRPIALPAAA